MENKDDPLYKRHSLTKYILIATLIFISVLFYFFVLSPSNMFGNVSSYYLPIYSFGESEFPPLEF
jgi:polyferredoxin